jgi:hypothetical protein
MRRVHADVKARYRLCGIYNRFISWSVNDLECGTELLGDATGHPQAPLGSVRPIDTYNDRRNHILSSI